MTLLSGSLSSSEHKMEKIYVLRCRDQHFYVGQTLNVDRRFAEHRDGHSGSEWTRLHPPIQIIEQTPKTSEFDELKTTLEYMKRYGIDRVRGAHWCNVSLTQEQRTAIQAALNTASCYRCGQKGHYSRHCPRSSVVMCYKCGQQGHYANTCDVNDRRGRNPRPAPQCNRCGRTSHSIDQCYATFDIDGRWLHR